MPLFAKISLVVLYFLALLCYGLDVYFARIDAGDSFIEAFKAGSIVFAAAFFLSSLPAFYISLFVEASMDKRCNG
jgi:hypothetical protein